MSMENWNKWVARDIITTVLLSLLLIVIQLVINMVAMLNDFVSMVLSVGISCFLCAPIYFLLVRRVRKRFVSLIYMLILGVVFLIMGDWFLLPYFAVITAVLGFLGCMVGRRMMQKHFKKVGVL